MRQKIQVEAEAVLKGSNSGGNFFRTQESWIHLPIDVPRSVVYLPFGWTDLGFAINLGDDKSIDEDLGLHGILVHSRTLHLILLAAVGLGVCTDNISTVIICPSLSRGLTSRYPKFLHEGEDDGVLLLSVGVGYQGRKADLKSTI